MATTPDDFDDDLRPEYDFYALKGAVRGKYAARYPKHAFIVRLAPDVAKAFASEDAVNDALREYLRLRDNTQTPV